jgi:hypothetical protein
MSASCSGPRSPEAPGRPRPGVTEVGASDLRFDPAAGQLLYVPAYSSVHTSDSPQEFRLAITLTIRNLDREGALFVRSVRYLDHDGRTVREFLARPVRIAPLAAAEFFVPESDRSGGFASSFLVEWVAPSPIEPPAVESVMVGTASTQGVSFTGAARVLTDLAAAGEGDARAPAP